METPRHPVFADIEQDAEASVAEAFARVAVEYFAATRSGEGRVSTALGPEELARRFDEPLPRSGRPVEDVLERLRRDVIPDSNHLCHPRSMGHQVSAPLPAAVWTESLVAALNQSAAVWEMSPVGTILEARVVRWMCDLAGLGPEAGGTFTSGGTEATFAALLAARAAALPNAWKEGVGAVPPVVLHGEHAHYAVARAVGELGLGTENAVAVPSRGFRMDVAALEDELDKHRAWGRRVMAVVATAGSTATGSFDDLEAIGRLCEARRIWLHVDGAHGASALLSPAHRFRVKGIERARSIAWDPHKMMLMPLSASVVLVRDERDLDAGFAQRAPYLFHSRGGARTWDQGVRSFQCSRRLDAVKVWVALQRYGADGLGVLYDRLCATARALHDQVVERRDFEALHEPESNILCFRFLGDRSLDDEQTLDALNLRLREAYNRSGEGWVTTTVVAGRRVLRVAVMNPRTTPDDTERTLDRLAATGAVLSRRHPGHPLGEATREGTILGTVGYMSPEQAKGRPVDFRSDQFAFGLIVYEMLTGRRAFDRPTPVETLAAVIRDEPVPLASVRPGIPPRLEERGLHLPCQAPGGSLRLHARARRSARRPGDGIRRRGRDAHGVGPRRGDRVGSPSLAQAPRARRRGLCSRWPSPGGLASLLRLAGTRRVPGGPPLREREPGPGVPSTSATDSRRA